MYRFLISQGFSVFAKCRPFFPALAQLETVPEVFMTDSQGLAHPRRFGLACHLGVWLGRPCFGVAKTRFIGTHAPLGTNKGDLVDLVDKEQVIGSVIRTRSNVKPVYVSIGHRITQLEAIELTLGSTTKYKIPEPTRLAHKISKIL